MKSWANFAQRSSKSKWQMRIEFLARRRPARSSWGRRSQNKMFWQLSWGHGRVLSSQFQISNGDPSSILISGTLRALTITESRSYKPSGIPSNRRLVFSEVIYYRTPCLWCKTRPSGPAPSASRIHPLLGRRCQVPVFGLSWSSRFRGVCQSIIHGFSVNPDRDFFGEFVKLYSVFFDISL